MAKREPQLDPGKITGKLGVKTPSYRHTRRPTSCSTEHCLPGCPFCLTVALHKWACGLEISHLVDNTDGPGLGSKHDICICRLKENTRKAPVTGM